MAKCATCGKEISEGYVWDGTDCFCNEECLAKAFNNDLDAVSILIDEGDRVMWEENI